MQRFRWPHDKQVYFSIRTNLATVVRSKSPPSDPCQLIFHHHIDCVKLPSMNRIFTYRKQLMADLNRRKVTRMLIENGANIAAVVEIWFEPTRSCQNVFKTAPTAPKTRHQNWSKTFEHKTRTTDSLTGWWKQVHVTANTPQYRHFRLSNYQTGRVTSIFVNITVCGVKLSRPWRWQTVQGLIRI